MSASISTKRKAIGVDFLKRTAGYITGATGSYISDAMPVTTSTLSEAKNTVAEVAAYTNTSIIPKLRQLKTQTNFRGIINWFTDKEEGYSSSVESDIAMDFDIDTDPVEIGESQITEIGKNANQISEAVVSSSHKMVEAQLAATANLINTAERQTAVITAGFDRTNDTLNKILEVLTHNTSTLIEATVASNSEKSENNRLASTGKFDLSSYKKMVSTNFQKSEYGMVASMIPMILGSGVIGPESIVELMLDVGLKKAAPNLKKNMKALDDAVSDTIMTSLIRLGENSNRFGMKGDIAKIFGIDSSRKNVDTSRSTIEVKAVPFDSIAHEAITNAIPGYLRKILVAVGGEDAIYDYRSRSFKSKGAIHKEFQEAARNRGTIYNASNNVRNSIGADDFSSMVYDLMMTELGSRTSNGSARSTVDKLSNKSEAQKYVKSLMAGNKLSRREREMLDIIAGNISSAASGTGGIDIMNQVAKTNIDRNSRVQNYVDTAGSYNIDLSEIRDGVSSEINEILEENGFVKKRRNKRNKSSSANIGGPSANVYGLNYTNMALYEIYRRLNEGINVFQVGSNNSRSEPFKKLGDDYLQKPQSYKAKPIGDYHGGASVVRSSMSGPSSFTDEENLLRNQELDDGSTENLSGGQRFARWGKKRGGDLRKAIFSGSPEQVKDAFGVIISEAGQAASDGIKQGAAKINDSFGNVSGYLKHKMFGTEYSYETTDENGKKVIKQIAGNEKGGILGFVKDSVKESFVSAKEKSSKWLSSVMGYFNYGDDDAEDSEEKKLLGKRKRLIASSVGAFAGAGILGGPIGLLVGAMAGNALSGIGMGKKIKNFLFGEDENGNPTGLISKTADAIISPIRYQVGKTIALAGGVLKKHILGPLSDIGLAIKDRITNHVDSMFKKAADVILTPLKKFGKFVFGGIAKGIGKVATGVANFASTTAPGKFVRGAMNVGGAFIGGMQESLAKGIAGGHSFHKLKRNERYIIKKGESYLDADGNEQRASEDMMVTGADGIKVQTKAYLAARRKDRSEEVNQDLEDSGYYGSGRGFLGKVKGFFGGDYKKWREADREKRSGRRSKFSEYTSETEKPTEDISRDTRNMAENVEKQTADSAEIKDDLHTLTNLGSEKGSIFTHDDGLHQRLDTLIEITRKNVEGSSISESDNKMLPAVVRSSIKADKEKQRQENIQFGNSLIGAAVNAADEGGIDSEDAGLLERITSDSQMGLSKSSIFGRFKELINRNKNKTNGSEKESEEKEESMISKFAGTIGKVLMDNWPIILGGLTLLSDNFRGWLKDIIPTLLGGVGETVAAANQEIDNLVTGAKTVEDPVTGERKSVLSAEKLAEKKADNLSSIKDAIHPLNLGKEVAIMSLEKTALRTGAAGVQGAARLVGGGAGIANFGTRLFQGGSAFVQGISQNGLNKVGLQKATSFAGTAFRMGGSEALQSVSSGAATTAASAGGFKAAMAKTFSPKAVFSLASVSNTIGGIASNAVASASWNKMEELKHQNILGDYGINKNAGGVTETNTTVKTVTTTTIGIGGGIAISAAVVTAKAGITAAIGTIAAGGTANAWNPVGWCLLVVAGILVISAALAALVNLLTGIYKDNANKDYAIRSNSSKLGGVINDKVSYVNGSDNSMYAYCAQESDRVLGFNQGVFIKDPELAFGKFLRTIADGLASSPGAEVLLYDFINNMAVQGVPFACFLAGDSEECKCDGAQANTSSTGTPPVTREGPLGGNYTQVLKSTVTKNKSKVFSDIAANIQRQDPNAVWTEENLKFVYESGKKVVDALTNKGIIKSNGKIDTGKFKGSPGSKRNASGWDALDELARKNDSYFLTQCLVYINSKIEVNKEGKQWLEARQDDVTRLMDGLKDLFIKESEEQVAEMKAQGMSDSEIEKALAASRDPKGQQAVGAADQTEASSLTIPSINGSSIKSEDKEDVEKELKYLTASYAYAHPTILQKWALEHESESTVSPDNIRRIENWKNEFQGNKPKQQILRSEMANAALNFAESAGDIFNLVPKFDWSEGGKIYTGKKKAPAEKHGSGFVIRGQEKSPGEGILSSLWNSGKVGTDETPEDIHKELYGDKTHGKGSESTSESNKWFVRTSGVIGRIADKITKYGSTEGEKLAEGKSKDKWKNVLLNLPASNPPNLPIGGGEDDPYSSVFSGINNTSDELNPDSVGDNDASLSDGNTKLPSPFIGDTFNVTSNYGWRTINGEKNYHSGIDLVPNSSDGKIGAVAPGVVTRVERNVSGFKQGSYGNYVEYKTADGTKVMNAHMKEGSIPTNIKSGTSISPGDVIGKMGNTGNSYGPHLHFQLENLKFDRDPKGTNTADPASLLGISTLSDTGKYSASDGYSGTSTGVTSSYTDTSSSDSSTSNESGLSRILEMLKNAGSKFLNFITGGLLSLDTTDQDSTTSSIGDSYTYQSSSGSNVTISGAGAHSAAAQLDPEIPIELLTNSEVNGISGFGGKAEVLDLKTGVSYMVSLGGKPGGTHTDYTPLTPEDTEKKRAAATSDGGSWPSWTPRPCILKVAGHQLAVGTHNYPHGSHIGDGKPGPSMPNNKNSKPAGQAWPIGGHFCMYFKDSVSNANGLSKNARQHQEAAAEAYNLAVAMIEEQKRAEEAAAQVQDGNQASLWTYLKSKGMSDAAVAGILGCWEAESKNSARRIEADNLRGFPGYDTLINDRQAMNDYTKNVVWAKTKRVDKKAYYGTDNNLYPGIGYAQWTGGRGQALIEFAKSTGKDWSAPSTQLDFMNKELNDPNSSYGPTHLNVLGKMSNTDDPSNAANIWAKLYEGNEKGADSSRISHANSVYNRYKGTVPDVPVGGGDVNIPSSNINLRTSSNVTGSKYKTTNLPRIGGASDSISVPGLATSINNKASSFIRRSSDNSITSSSHTIPVDGDSGTKNIINLLYEVIDELKDIAGNTGSSSELLGSLNEKDFVDKGLRESMSSLSKTTKKNYARHAQTNSANVRTVTAMARP